ncbi:MAG: choice-of-anchor B family protein, partial [Phycisphaerales bacterium]
HQGWLSDDRHYLYVSDELDNLGRTSMFDVSDLTSPKFIGDFSSTAPTATDHNLYVRDGFIFETNYTSGLRVFNACDPVNPVEVGFFDTFPANDDPGFSGAWSNYPFFPSGTVIVSDRSGGLFVLDVSEAVAGGCGGCEADLDGDGTVGATDLLTLLVLWGSDPGGPPDFDGDGTVGASDLLFLLVSWGPCP